MTLGAIPLRLRVLMALTATLQEAVYSYLDEPDVPLTGKVFRGRVIFGETDPLPMLSILEAPLMPEQLPSPFDSTDSKGDWDLLIQGFVDDDHENPTDPAHYLMAATKQRLAHEKARDRDFAILGLGKHVTGISWGAGVVRPPDEISAKAYFWLPLTLTLVEDLAKPYEVIT